MNLSKDERNRILYLVEAGQVNALQASQLLDALEEEAPEHPRERGRERVLRVRATQFNPKRQKVNFTATLPIGLIKISLRLGAQILPQLSSSALEDLLHSVEHGATGRLLDLHDLEKGERMEIFVE